MGAVYHVQRLTEETNHRGGTHKGPPVALADHFLVCFCLLQRVPPRRTHIHMWTLMYPVH